MNRLLVFFSMLFFAVGMIYFFTFSKERPLRQRLLCLTGTIIVSIFCMELYKNTCENGSVLSGDVFVNTMQVFSLDYDYHERFDGSGSVKTANSAKEVGKDGRKEDSGPEKDTEQNDYPTPVNEPGQNNLAARANGSYVDAVIRFYTILLYSVAPVVGGAIIFDVLAGISPGLRLFFHRRGRIYLFSELNRQSLSLAESVFHKEEASSWTDRPVLVFTDCLSEPSETETEELKARASSINAICLPDSLNICRRLHKARQCVIFLMNSGTKREFDDIKNLSLLRELLESKDTLWEPIKGCNIFCFSNCSAAIESFRTAKNHFDITRSKLNREDEIKNVKLHVIQDYAQSSNALMKEHPLFEYCASKKTGEPLRVLLVGDDEFSREMFKTVFWCGQILDHPLQIAMVSYSDASDAGRTDIETWINVQSPEWLESCTQRADCLKLSLKGEYSEPYASLYFSRARKEAFFLDSFLTETRTFQYGSEEGFRLADFDYMILMTGKEEDNVELADSLWRRLVYLKDKAELPGIKTIALATENKNLAQVTQLRYNDLYMTEQVASVIPFGSLEERFRWDKILTIGSYSTEDIHSAEAALHSLPSMDVKNNVTDDEIYDDLSSFARNVHLQCKMFSAGCYTARNREDKQDRRIDYCDKIRYIQQLKNNPRTLERLSWLEHRRWNAFLRTQGFRRPPGLEEKLRDFEEGRCDDENWQDLVRYSHKNVPAHLHPNLVECFSEDCFENRDLLDIASDLRKLVVKKKDNKESGSIKQYDRPDGKYGPVFNREEVCTYLLGTELSATSAVQKAAWERVQTEFPKLAECEAKNNPGYYYTEFVMMLKKDRS